MLVATPMVDHSATSLRPPSISSADNRPVSPVFMGEPLVKIDFIHSNPESCDDSAHKSIDIVFNSLDLVGE